MAKRRFKTILSLAELNNKEVPKANTNTDFVFLDNNKLVSNEIENSSAH
jgi:hypothetical protein